MLEDKKVVDIAGVRKSKFGELEIPEYFIEALRLGLAKFFGALAEGLAKPQK